MSDQLTPALLIPYDAAGENLDDAKTITLDFNPETLKLKIQAGEEADRGREGRQQTQHVAKSTATLSFDAVFDTTRPNPARGGSGDGPASPEKLDVRIKTAAIAGLSASGIPATSPGASSSGSASTGRSGTPCSAPVTMLQAVASASFMGAAWSTSHPYASEALTGRPVSSISRILGHCSDGILRSGQ